MTDLTGKRAFVLGGSRGIGAAITERLAALGADTVFTYVSAEDAATALALRTGARAIRADSADRDAVVAAIAGAGPLDIVIINAAMGLFADPLTADPETIDRMIDINIRAPYHAAVEAARKMPDNGRIVLIGSANADRIPMPGATAYVMTKAALQGLAKGLSRDFGARGITVNVVQPGPVDTDLNPADGPMAPMMHGMMAIQRHAKPQEIAGYVAYLVSPEAAMITGTTQTIDGGFTA